MPTIHHHRTPSGRRVIALLVALLTVAALIVWISLGYPFELRYGAGMLLGATLFMILNREMVREGTRYILYRRRVRGRWVSDGAGSTCSSICGTG